LQIHQTLLAPLSGTSICRFPARFYDAPVYSGNERKLVNLAHEKKDGHECVNRESLDESGADDHRRLDLTGRFRLTTYGFHSGANRAAKSYTAPDGGKTETYWQRKSEHG
jgi:hypothetical protein